MDMITVEKRDFAVKAKKLRWLGLVPGSVFGGPLREALALQLEEADARRLVEQKREGSKLKIVLDGQQIPVQIKEKAVNLLNNDILHLSFQALHRIMSGKPAVRHFSGRSLIRGLIGLAGTLALGMGMCMTMLWGMLVPGVAVGFAGIVLLLCLIPLCRGIKE